MFQMIELEAKLQKRIDEVRDIARKYGEDGIVAWTKRAVGDARLLGKLRDKDVAVLERLEETFAHDYYRNGRDARSGNSSGPKAERSRQPMLQHC
jgi:hypothetical protein